MKKILIYGAGAIGRGYLPWVFSPQDYDYYFVESNSNLRNLINERKSYSTFKTTPFGYVEMNVPVKVCYSPGEEKSIISTFDAVATAVGPRNFLGLKDSLMNTTVPVISCENDSLMPAILSKMTNNPNIVFAIPDVITSCTAPAELLKNDPLSITTEDGVCFIDEKVAHLKANASYVSKEELVKQWAAKLYIHNTPHCVTAYFGSIIGVTYLHESMENSVVSKIVEGCMREMEQMLIKKYNIDKDFLAFYSNKELSRFRNKLLFDPIARVAREPFRKLASNDRLIGAANLCLSSGIVPTNLITGIMSAFCFESDNDPDFHIKFLMNGLSSEEFLRTIIGLHDHDALFSLLIEHWNENLKLINNLKK